METIIFMFCITLHNIEEAVWITNWMAKNMPNSYRFHKREHFIFAVLGITILAYLTAGLFMFFPNNQYFEYIFIGFVGAMLINAIIPHLILTIKYKKYYPGVLTGCFLIIPLHLIILYNSVNSHLRVNEIIISTLIVGVILLGAIPIFKCIAEKVLD